MEEQELPGFSITEEDIKQANQLSLHCPICAGPVEKFTNEAELTPVICIDCGTLYHKVCWEQNGNKCAIIGCSSTKYRVYGQQIKPELTIGMDDVRRVAANGRYSPSAENKDLKYEQQRQVQRISLFRRLFRWLLDQIRIG
ncbi:MAG: RING finger protein [Chloroflexota bacterium]